MGDSVIEKRMELIVVFQEKLLTNISDSSFREMFIEPLLYTDNEQVFLNLVDQITKDEEVKELIDCIVKSGECSHESIKMELLILLRKIIERLATFDEDMDFDDDYIG